MSNQRTPRRSPRPVAQTRPRLLLALGLALLTLPLVPVGEAETTGLMEDWEAGWGAWMKTGPTAPPGAIPAQIACSVAQDGACSLHFTPSCCGTIYHVSRFVGIPIGTKATVSFMFRGTSTAGDTDSGFRIQFNNGAELGVEMTEGIGSPNNNVMTVSGSNGPAFASWSSANAWYKTSIILDGTTRTWKAELRTASGTLIGASSTQSYSSQVSSITTLKIHAVMWNPDSLSFYYDAIHVADTFPTYAQSWEAGWGGWSLTPPPPPVEEGTKIDCTQAYAGSCSLRMYPFCCGTSSVSQNVNIPIDGPEQETMISFALRSSSNSGGTDSHFRIDLDAGSPLVLSVPGNGQVSANNGGPGTVFAAIAPQVWYTATVFLDSEANAWSAELHSSSGTLVGASPTLALSSTPSRVTSLKIEAWNSPGITFHYDDIRIQSRVPTTCEIDSPSSDWLLEQTEIDATRWTLENQRDDVGWQVSLITPATTLPEDLGGHTDPVRLWYTSINATQNNYQSGEFENVSSWGTATSPSILVPDWPRLHFSSRYEVESRDPIGRDKMSVRYSANDGASWKTLCYVSPVTREPTWGTPDTSVCSDGTPHGAHPCEKDDLGSARAMWETRSIDLPPSLAGRSILLQFKFDTIDGIDNDGLGWMITDIRLS